jgi:quercetin dioxygenase-like cupin family protein
MWFSLFDHPDGVEPLPGNRIVLDVGRGEAWFGDAGLPAARALVWELSEHEAEGAKLVAEVELDRDTEWLMRCDRIDFPPGGVAYRHVHPGPGIRYLLFGSLAIDAEGHTRTHGPGEAWFEGADYPVLATADETVDTAFVRVLLLPREWEGKRTIRYLDPADEERPKLQRATVYLEQPIEL